MNMHILTPKDAYHRADGIDVDKQAQIITKKVREKYWVCIDWVI